MVRTIRKIPSEWTKYESVGTTISNSRIFAFKTPLYPELQNRIAKSERLTTLNLLQKLAFSGRSLGLVINCNNTSRYYNGKDFEGVGICYKEIPCPGRGFLDRSDLVKLFLKTVDEFLSSNAENDLLIGVNCSNGVNRSGYLICNYLISRLGWSSHDALNAFESSRGYPIERGSYVQALHKADREYRTRTILNISAGDDQDGGDMSRKNKAIIVVKERDTSNIPLASRMMQQFFNMEQQFKQIAETTIAHSSADSSPAFLNPIEVVSGSGNEISGLSLSQKSFSKPKVKMMSEKYDSLRSANAIPAIESNKIQKGDVDDEMEAECVSEDELDDNFPSSIDFDSMGRVDVSEPISKSQQRRQRRQKREKMFQVMKRGRFWEINEMRKEMQE